MATYNLPNTIRDKDLIEFDLFTVKDSSLVNDKKILQNLEASSSLINTILREKKWRGYSYIENGVRKIGYGLTAGSESDGLSEIQSYGYFIEDFKQKERNFKKLLPLNYISQSCYDALLSLYYYTGTIKTIGSESRRFDINDYVINEKWQYIASILVLTNDNRTIRQLEASIMMLADYGSQKDRTTIRSQGIQEIRTLYPNRFDDTLSLKQAEYIYYKETKRFLPLMTQSRKRQIVNQINSEIDD